MRFIFLGVLIVLFSHSALAQSNDEEASAAFRKGIDLFEAQQYKEAADAFRKAYALKPNWKIYYNIGQSEAAAKRHGLALEAFEAYLVEGGDDVAEERRGEVEQDIERLRKIVGFLRVEASDGLPVVIDGVERGQTPLSGTLALAAGVDHEVIVGDLDPQMTSVSGGQTIDLTFAQEAPSKPVVQEKNSPEPERDSGSSLKTWGWIGVGVGGALLVGGAITGGLALAADNEIDDECQDGCYSDQYDKLDKRDGLALGTDIMLAVGGAAAVAGTVIVIVAYRREARSESIALHPIVAPGTAGVALEWRF